MMKSVKRLALLALMIVASFQLKAQFHFGLNAIGTFPVSHWAEEGAANFGTNPYKGNANIVGAGIGLRFQYDFSWRYNGIVSPFVDIDGLWNPKNKETKAIYDQYSCTLAHYINAPIMAGAMYRYFLNYQKPIIGFFVEGAIGADLLYVTPEGWEGQTQKYEISPALAVRIGAGICLTPQLNIGVHYAFFGNHSINVAGAKEGFDEVGNSQGVEFPMEIELRMPDKLKESAIMVKLTYIIKGNKLKQLPLRNSPL